MLNTAIVNLGCPKNEVDAEKLAFLLTRERFSLVEPETAEIIIVNTCGFIQPAVEEAIETILEMAEFKQNRCRCLVVSGCLPQRFGSELIGEISEIDLLFGVADWDRIPAAISDFLARPEQQAFVNRIGPRDYARCQALPQLVTPPAASAYLKIAEGCDNRCTYCMIPAIKGRQQSVPPKILLEQARRLAGENGIRELNLVAQDITAYGSDLDADVDLCDLLERLCEIPELGRLRLLYAYPGRITPRLIELLRSREQICNYIDVPIQHINDKILAAMGRRERGSEIRHTLTRLKESIPDLYLRTTVMVGFPGESAAAFLELQELVESGLFDYLGAFSFWPEEGSPAAKLAGQVPQPLKEERQAAILAAQKTITEKRLQAEIGRTRRVLVEGLSPESDLLVAGRTDFQAPEIDGTTYITEGDTRIGELVEVEIHDSHQFDLFARIREDDE